MPKLDFLSNVLLTMFGLLLDTLRFIRVSLRPRCALAAERHAQGSPGYGNAVLNFALAFENEFRTRIAERVARELVKPPGLQYQPEKAEAPFVEGGVLYPNLQLGNYSWYVRNDSSVQQISTKLGVNVDKLGQALYRLSPLRNEAAHPPGPVSPKGGCEVRRPISPKKAHEVTEMILGPGSILKLLFPSTGSV